MNTKEAIDTLSRDCNLINEAARRLIDGTCCLGEYDRPFLEDLFNKVQFAVSEHVAFEEEVFYPSIGKDEVLRMQQEHTKLTDLLKEARFAIENERSLTFKILIKEFDRALNEHTAIESHVLRAFEMGQIKSDKFDPIQGRVSKKIV